MAPRLLPVWRVLVLCAAPTAFAQTPQAPQAPQTPASEPAIYQGADLTLGRQLIAQHRCAECHARKFGGNGNAVYRPQGRVNTAGLLRGMVEQCNTELNLGLFPEEVTAVAAVLNREHYRFTR
jgi:cytochrome c553